MRILLPTIRDVGQIGGTTTHLDMLSRGLEDIGHQARVFYLGEALPGVLNQVGVVWPAGVLNRARTGWGMVYAAAVRGRLLAWLVERELRRAREAGRPWDVLNAQEVYSVSALREAADRNGVPLVLTLHGYPLYESLSEGYTRSSALGRGFLMRAEMQALRLADAVVTVDTRLYNHVVRLVPERTERVTALMNFIDTAAFFPSREGREALRRAWDVPEDRTVLFCPRRLVKKNGVVYPALALAEMAPEERRRFFLLHAGEGGEREAIEAVIREHGLQGEVRLLGGQGRDAIVELYRLADIVLVPSVHSENVEEATSLAALEAMASGRPLIAGAVGGLAEMVRDGENGLLVPGGDAGALAAAILRLAAAPDLGVRLAEQARAYVVENHSHLRAARAYVDVYREAVARPAASAAPGAEPVTSAVGGPAAPPTVSVLGFPLHLVDLSGAAEWIMAAARPRPAPAPAVPPASTAAPVPGGARAAPAAGRTRIAVSFNPELVVRAWDDPRAAEALLEADLRYPDGVGAVWAVARQGVRGVSRVPGIELAEAVLRRAAAEGLPVYFLGAAEGVAAEAARRMTAALPGLTVVGTYHGYFSPHQEAAVVERVRASGAALLLVALGAPRQEVFLRRHRDRLGALVALGVGGSFDVWSGRVKRAPRWAQDWGVEWLYRLVAEPRRFRRQLALPRFALRVMVGVPDDYGPGRTARPSAKHSGPAAPAEDGEGPAPAGNPGDQG